MIIDHKLRNQTCDKLWYVWWPSGHNLSFLSLSLFLSFSMVVVFLFVLISCFFLFLSLFMFFFPFCVLRSFCLFFFIISLSCLFPNICCFLFFLSLFSCSLCFRFSLFSFFILFQSLHFIFTLSPPFSVTVIFICAHSPPSASCQPTPTPFIYFFTNTSKRPQEVSQVL